ncbi:hypothetical protein BST95_01210 [Halioglobus japonicus]|uniref:Methyltransferase domain-containing protein n=1 Tax=Halioglobus japonicus TaxID=930805 RepID=A0AAP8MBU7_9GAMM|nr:WcbI family polysaccharide biosynthesis putative acetyltransferase [Halioglobus japonicus]AQA17035.1 hypothetical protein BST95_01210 [Halioglobus japonicus]PLW84942.1 methyltransferase domain-containing protein [Halioglobus japonicus]
MKIAIFANCQAEALAILVDGIYTPRFEVIFRKPTFLWEDCDETAVNSALADADILLYQPHIAHTWLPSWKTSDYWTRTTVATQIISFPSIYFSGYSPELTYVRKPDGSHLNNGLCDYHDKRIIYCYLMGLPEYETARLLGDFQLHRETVRRNIELSLEELERRENEQNLSVRLKHYIAENCFHDRLFFTFNHPSNKILYEVVKQLLSKLGLEHTPIPSVPHELLGFDIFPLQNEVRDSLQACSIRSEHDYVIQGNPMSTLEIVQRYYQIYRDNQQIVQNFREANEEIFKPVDEAYQSMLTEREASGTQFEYDSMNFEQAFYHKEKAQDRLRDLTLDDVHFTLTKCDPQTLSFYSDIAFHLRRLYPEIDGGIKRVLDVGSRTGAGSALLQKIHHPESFSAVRMQVEAIDIEEKFEPYVNAFSPEISYTVGDIFDLPANSREIVICSHTIEHVSNPAAFIDRLCDIAKEFVIIACPFEEPSSNLIPGHVHSIDRKFIRQFNPVFLEIYNSMHWHQSKACIFAINCGYKNQTHLRRIVRKIRNKLRPLKSTFKKN